MTWRAAQLLQVIFPHVVGFSDRPDLGSSLAAYAELLPDLLDLDFLEILSLHNRRAGHHGRGWKDNSHFT